MKKVLLITLLCTAIFLAGCGEDAAAKDATRVYKLGVNGTDHDIWNDVSSRLEAQGIRLEIVEFTDYVLPNQALAQKEIDLNSFQTEIYLNNFTEAHGLDLSVIGYSVVAPMGIYSEKHGDLENLPDTLRIAIPNDTSNGGRALRFLQELGFLTVDDSAGLLPTMQDITGYNYDIEITEMAAPQIPRSLQDVDFGIINNGIAYEAGLTIAEDALEYEDPNGPDMKNYWNVIVCRTEDAEKADYLAIAREYETVRTQELLIEKFGGQQIPVFDAK